MVNHSALNSSFGTNATLAEQYDMARRQGMMAARAPPMHHAGMPSDVRSVMDAGTNPPPPAPSPTDVLLVDALATGGGLSVMVPDSAMVDMPYATQSAHAKPYPVPKDARLYCALTGDSFPVPSSGDVVESGGFVYVAAAHGDALYLVRCARAGDSKRKALCNSVKKVIASAAVADTPAFGALVVAAYNMQKGTFSASGGDLNVHTGHLFMDSIVWCGKPQGTINGTQVDFSELGATPSMLSGTTIAASSPGTYTAGGVDAPAALFMDTSSGGAAPVLDASGFILPQGALPNGKIAAYNHSTSTAMNVSGSLQSVPSVAMAPLAGGLVRMAQPVSGAKGFTKTFSSTVKKQGNTTVVTWGAALVIVTMDDGTVLPVSPLGGRGDGYFAPAPARGKAVKGFGGILYAVRNTLFVLPNTEHNAASMVGAANPYKRAEGFKVPFLEKRVLGLPVWVWLAILVVLCGALLYKGAHHLKDSGVVTKRVTTRAAVRV